MNFVEGVGEDVRIYEEDRADGEIRRVSQVPNVNKADYKWTLPPEDKKGWIEIHVPKGTVKQGYSVDLK